MGKVSDGKIIVALLEYGSVTAAAAALGCSRHTIHNRMKEPAFLNEYENRKFQIMSAAFMTLAGNIDNAIITIADVMNDEEAAPAVRMQAAQTILKNAAQYFETVESIKCEEFGEDAKTDDLSEALSELAQTLKSDPIT